MNLLFIENRYKTYFWEAIAKELKNYNYQISWIIQNHTFTPNQNNIHKVPYPNKNTLAVKNIKKEKEKKIFDFIKTTDRVINYFNGNNNHYNYYYNEFEKIIVNIKPDLVIGESTLFHELIIIDICKRNNIVYLHPSSTSYPIGRFSFFLYDSKEAYKGSNEVLSNEAYDSLIKQISTRKIIPDYMRGTNTKNNRYSLIKSLKNKFTILFSYVNGEKYNTPSPIAKYIKDKNTITILKKWNALSTKNIENIPKKNIILYPLQMQPEANLDVWGNKFQNQAKLIIDISACLPENCCLVIKPNPKSKYEMNDELLNIVKKSENIIALHSATKMKDIFDISDIVLTVTGTVAIECILTAKPLGLLGPSIVQGFGGCHTLENIKELNVLISLVENRTFITSTIEDKRNLIKKLMSSSYQGLISDPISTPNCLEKDNLDLIIKAIVSIGENHESVQFNY